MHLTRLSIDGQPFESEVKGLDASTRLDLVLRLEVAVFFGKER